MRAQAALEAVRARQQELEARSIEQRGTAEALNVRENLLRTLAAQNARYAAAGLALGDGTPQTVAEETAADAERELDIVRTNTAVAAESARMGAAQTQARAQLLRSQAGWTQTAGMIGAAATGLTGAARLLDRMPGRAQPGIGGALRTAS
jgi:hypothetical protein